ncbi:hypothetical protein Micbo1qcDRAFT_128717 [Microdochium bolleyi]|uniref:Azaphilone pigments biosynthesis cluster protein L N-terminal domain-containing protein n=1 Tax=Microdochium bolleyi TaxID=196109 RepID=A0A136IJH6_9PEZI|nr:hypothetical protein Micbo1qcDRAFT_128717 [Microdochium bolleyi]
MMDPLSVSAGVIAVVTATLQTSRALYRALRDIQDRPRTIRQLTEELRGLEEVLTSLENLARSDEAAVKPLTLPLTQCWKACASFQDLLVDSVKHTKGSKLSFRDWARLQYMGNDVAEFTSMIASYKSTMCIALADANLRSSTVTLKVLRDYQTMIQNTTSDLEHQLEKINTKLQYLSPGERQNTTTGHQGLQNLHQERESTTKCLEICADVLAHMTSMRFQPVAIEDVASSVSLSPEALSPADVITISALQECISKVKDTMQILQAHNDKTEERFTIARLNIPSGITGAKCDQVSDRLGSELDSTKQCLAICDRAASKASSEAVHVLEDVDIGPDGQQMLIASLGELFQVKGVKLGERATQIVGALPPSAIDELIRNIAKRGLS